jgi:GNAT superfamily N-acetyltransferase
MGPPLSFAVEEIHPDRAALMEAAMGSEAELVRPRFERGCRCFAVLLDGSIAGYGWLSTSTEWIGELQLEITPLAGEAYVWNCATLTEHRRKGIFRSLLAGIASEARTAGFRRLWIGTVHIPAEKAMRPAGFRPAFTFRTLRVPALHVLVATPAPDENSLLISDAKKVLDSPVAPLRMGMSIRRATRRRH